MKTLRSGEGAWKATGFEGIQVRRLFVDRERETVSMLVKMAAGARYPRHRHAAVEECYVIEGDLHVTGTVLLQHLERHHSTPVRCATNLRE